MAREQKSIKKNTIYNMLKTFSSIIFPLITFPYVSRVLSPVGIGRYNFSSTYVGYFSLIASLGITTYAIRECAAVRDDQEKLDKVSSQIFSINICTMLIAYAALLVSLVFFRKLDSYRNLIIIFSSNILFTILGADWINSAFEDFRYITLRTFGMQLISLICIFIFVRKPSDVINYALITVLASGGANILNMFYRRRFCRMHFIKDMRWKKHMPGITMLFVMLLAQSILYNTDVTMIGLLKTDYDVGLYSTAYKIKNIIAQVVASILFVLLPRLSTLYSDKDYSKINPLLQKTLQFMLGLGLPSIVGTIVLARPIIKLVGGSDYTYAAVYLRLLMISFLVSLFGSSFIGNIILLPSKKEKYFMQACLLAAVINVILNYLFIIKIGPEGAAIASIICEIVMLIYMIPHVEKEIDIGSIKKLISAPVIGCSVIVVCCLCLNHINVNYWLRFILQLVFSVLLYAFVLYAMRYEIFINAVNQLLSKIKRKN